MSGKPREQYDDVPHGDAEEIQGAPTPNRLTKASDARRRLEDYWAQKALDEELREIDDWDDDSQAADEG